MDLTPEEIAAWVLLGDPYAPPMPVPLRDLAERIAQAIRQDRRKQAYEREKSLIEQASA